MRVERDVDKQTVRRDKARRGEVERLLPYAVEHGVKGAGGARELRELVDDGRGRVVEDLCECEMVAQRDTPLMYQPARPT